MSEHEHEWGRLLTASGQFETFCIICGATLLTVAYDRMATELASVKERLASLETSVNTLVRAESEQ